MNLHEKFGLGLPYHDFLAKHGNEGDRDRWKMLYDQVTLTELQRHLLASFNRQMPVLCLAGAWCGDCVQQCPIFEHFAQATPTLQLRFLDRDVHADVQQVLQINGGNRVPVLVFFSEDGFEVARFGERTLSKYRQMMRDQVNAPISMPSGSLLSQVTQDWLNEFERAQWILRLSARLRKKHND